ncbi:MAG TPA: SRPBCC domain-containing protein [Crenalkalicoccus sp.]|nr:SRPBCC domain-containing protein [Crenalkalicoccus sp.]
MSDDAFVITRTLDAPRDRVWDVWTRLEHLERWFGPKGVTLFGCSLDLRPGGTFHYGMRGSDGFGEHWGRWVFREIAPLERLVFLVSFSDEAGGITRNPWDAVWPLRMLSTVIFAAEGPRRTTVTVHWEPFEATEAERAAFAAGHASMRQGWGGTLEKLETYLAGDAS